jgi:pyridoxal phosphate enzyme (YggS family)
VKSRIDKAAKIKGRNRDDILIVAVSKYVTAERIMKATKIGILDFGENKAQDFNEKFNILDKNLNWHFIGHLQKNKVKYIIGKTKLIHSIDNIDVVKEINKRAEIINIDRIDVLVQVNISKEFTKTGVFEENLKEFIKSISKFKRVNIKGLMTIAPYSENKESIRYVFKGLRECYEELPIYINESNFSMEILSMGMSNDFEIAIEEGSNLVRLGTVLFKE